MNIVPLNMRGWGDAEKRRRLRQFLCSGNFGCCLLQETKWSSLTSKAISSIWGRGICIWVVKNSIGRYGGLLCVWRKDLFEVLSSFFGKSFTGLFVNQNGSTIYLINFYSPYHIEAKRTLWREWQPLKSEM